MSEPAAAPDLSEFFKYSRPKRPPCKVGYALTQLKSSKDRALALAALATDSNLITPSAVTTWFEKRGIDTITSTGSVIAHRKKKCTCYD